MRLEIGYSMSVSSLRTEETANAGESDYARDPSGVDTP